MLALAYILLALVILLFVMAVIKGRVFGVALAMLSRLFVSGERCEAPPLRRRGGLEGLSRPLVALVVRRRKLEAAVQVLRELVPAYHRSFETEVRGILDDRRRRALRRDFEDAVIHVVRALDGWCEALRGLDEESRVRLHATGAVPDVPALLLRFPWLPREVHQIGHLHFRDDEPELEAQVFALDEALQGVEHALLRQGAGAYR